MTNDIIGSVKQPCKTPRPFVVTILMPSEPLQAPIQPRNKHSFAPKNGKVSFLVDPLCFFISIVFGSIVTSPHAEPLFSGEHGVIFISFYFDIKLKLFYQRKIMTIMINNKFLFYFIHFILCDIKMCLIIIKGFD